MRRLWLTVGLACGLAGGGAAAAEPYANARFGYVIDLPAGFAPVVEAENSDGGTSRAGEAKLAVWGAYVLDGEFSDEVAGRIAGDERDGWTVTYRSVRSDGASWSGTRGRDILYSRAIPLCGNAVGFFRLDYPRGERRKRDATVAALVKSFRPAGGC